MELPVSLTMLTNEVFYSPGQARQTHTFAASGLDGVFYWVCRHHDVFQSPLATMWQGCVHEARRTGCAASFGFAECSYGQYWKMLVCSFLFSPFLL